MKTKIAASLPVLFGLCLAFVTTAQPTEVAASEKALLKNPFVDALPENTPDQLALRCLPGAAKEPALRSDMFRWNYNLDEIISRFFEIYEAAERLPLRNAWSADKGLLILPYHQMRGGPVAVPMSFVHHLSHHVSEAHRLGYVDGVFFPDMGHSHFLIPDEHWATEYDPIPIDKMSLMYEKFFADPELKILYHTAEQLKTREADGSLVDDRATQWRYYSRNLMADNNGRGALELLQNHESSANTAHGLPGHHWWGAGYNISAHEKGCIAYRDRQDVIRFLDLSLFDLETSAMDEYPNWVR